MPNIRKNFDSYKIQYTSSKRDIPLASISCFQGTTWVGLIEFWANSSNVRDPFAWNDRIVLSYTLERFNDVVNTLRNESPLELYLNPTGKWGSILTKELEPVGEDEAIG
ncbi:MAG: hypothetical protein SWO11_21340 [Thermodesulfobacteriota bacterium]|nr:hypothetical protein [Thermodesulfobacteriota bacterium]